MAGVLYWEEIEEGMEIPPLEKQPTTQQLVKYAGASGDFYQIHYDTAFAQSTGLSGVIIHGASGSESDEELTRVEHVIQVFFRVMRHKFLSGFRSRVG